MSPRRTRPRILRITGAAALVFAAGCVEVDGSGPENSVRLAGLGLPPSNETARFPSAMVFREIAQAVTPAVVNVTGISHEGRRWHLLERGRPGEPFLEGFFRGFWGFPAPAPIHPQPTVGSGFIVHEAGYILTNHHVVEATSDLRVRLSDRRELAASIVATDSSADLALIRVAGDSTLPTVILGQSSSLEQGEWAIAVGNPLGLDRTVTVGVISGLGRRPKGLPFDEGFIQTDASINFGNSGGPLLNARGEVVGINTAIIPVGWGIGFAVPVDRARRFAERAIRADLSGESGWLGVRLDRLDSKASGVGLAGVIEDSPAERAGLKTGDRILALDGVSVDHPLDLSRRIRRKPPTREVRLFVRQEGKDQELNLRLALPPQVKIP